MALAHVLRYIVYKLVQLRFTGSLFSETMLEWIQEIIVVCVFHYETTYYMLQHFTADAS